MQHNLKTKTLLFHFINQENDEDVILNFQEKRSILSYLTITNTITTAAIDFSKTITLAIITVFPKISKIVRNQQFQYLKNLIKSQSNGSIFTNTWCSFFASLSFEDFNFLNASQFGHLLLRLLLIQSLTPSELDGLALSPTLLYHLSTKICSLIKIEFDENILIAIED